MCKQFGLAKSILRNKKLKTPFEFPKYEDHRSSALLKITPPPLKTRKCAMKPSEMDSLSNSRLQNREEFKPSPLKTWECAIKPSKIAFLSTSIWQKRKEHPNRSKFNGDMDEKCKSL